MLNTVPNFSKKAQKNRYVESTTYEQFEGLEDLYSSIHEIADENNNLGETGKSFLGLTCEVQ